MKMRSRRTSISARAATAYHEKVAAQGNIFDIGACNDFKAVLLTSLTSCLTLISVSEFSSGKTVSRLHQRLHVCPLYSSFTSSIFFLFFFIILRILRKTNLFLIQTWEAAVGLTGHESKYCESLSNTKR